MLIVPLKLNERSFAHRINLFLCELETKLARRLQKEGTSPQHTL